MMPIKVFRFFLTEDLQRSRGMLACMIFLSTLLTLCVFSISYRVGKLSMIDQSYDQITQKPIFQT